MDKILSELNVSDTDILLDVDQVVMSFGGLVALDHPDFKVKRRTIKAVMGPNGAGKTTLFNVITGFLVPTKGNIRFRGDLINGLKPHQIAGRGISRTFQTVELFENMSVLEHILVGRHRHLDVSFIASGLSGRRSRRLEREAEEESMDLLKFIGLAHKYQQPAQSLPLGEQKILEIGRALATGPQLICLDEPAAGLNETETRIAASLITAIKARGTTVLLVEHDIKMVMDISDEIVVLNHGKKIADGYPQEISNDECVIEAYLGGELFCA